MKIKTLLYERLYSDYKIRRNISRIFWNTFIKIIRENLKKPGDFLSLTGIGTFEIVSGERSAYQLRFRVSRKYTNYLTEVKNGNIQE
jgi:nucleoid DNA-binding protein